jgi:Ca-activated chloride channel family protein
MKIALDVVKELGIKIYTVGIGNTHGKTIMHPFYGPIVMPGVNKELLDHIAQQTGGKSFLAHSAADMRDIYQTIDRLERTRHETVIFGNYYDIYVVPTILLILWSLLEFFLATFVWFVI